MRLNDNALMVILQFILILIGIGSFLNFRLYPTNNYLIYGVYGLAAIVMVLVFLGKVKENIGMIIFAVWLAIMGAMSMYNLSFAYSDTVLGVLPIGSGVFLLFGL